MVKLVFKARAGYFLVSVLGWFAQGHARLENLVRDVNGVVTHVRENGGNVDLSAYTSSKFAAESDGFAGRQTTVLDPVRQKLFVAETTLMNRAEKSFMSAQPQTSGGARFLQLQSEISTPAASTNFSNKKFAKILQTEDKIVAVLDAGVFDKFYIFNKATGEVTVSAPVKDLAGADSLIDNFVLAGDKIVAAIFQGGRTIYNSNGDGCIKVFNMDGTEIGVAKNGVDDLRVRTSESTSRAGDLIGICGPKNLTQVGAMHWDADLQRLFIAFSRNDGTLTAKDAMPFLVCRFDGDDLKVEGFAPLALLDGIVSFQLQFSDIVSYAIPCLVTTQDLAGNKYLLANINYFSRSGISGSPDLSTGNKEIFCLPILGADKMDAAGKFAKKNFSGPAGAPADCYGKVEAPVLVGGAGLPISTQAQVTAMLTVGTTVLVSTTAGSDLRPYEAGIWASTALFDDAGLIKGWTPWSRAAGVARSVYAMHFDPTDGQLWYLFDVDDAAVFSKPFGIAKTTLGEGNETKTEGGLRSLGQKVKTNLEHIISAKHFSAVRSRGLGKYSLSVFGSVDKVFLAGTGEAKSVLGDSVDPYEPGGRTKPVGLGSASDVYLADDKKAISIGLPGVGAVFSAEVLSFDGADATWLFLGTSKGIGVFSKSAGSGGDGAGWTWDGPTLDDLTLFEAPVAAGAPEVADNFYFRALKGLTEPVLQLEGRKKGSSYFLYAVTSRGLYRISVAQNNFKKAAAADLVPVPVFSASSNERILGLHLLPDSHCGFLLTSNDQTPDPTLPLRTQPRRRAFKLYRFNSLDQATSNGNFVDVSDAFGDISEITKIQILPINQFNSALKSNSELLANLLVTTGGLARPSSEVYVLPVFGKLVRDPAALSGMNKNYFFEPTTVGDAKLLARFDASKLGPKLCLGTNLFGVGYSYASAHLPNTALLRSYAAGFDTEIPEENLRVVGSWIDSATGSLVVAGNFGIKIQE